LEKPVKQNGVREVALARLGKTHTAESNTKQLNATQRSNLVSMYRVDTSSNKNGGPKKTA